MTFKTPILCLALLGSCVSHGDSVRDNFGSRSTFHAEQKTVDKINHQGQTLWMSDPVPVEAGRAYAGTLTLDVLSRTPGAAASVRFCILFSRSRVRFFPGTQEFLPGRDKELSVYRFRENALPVPPA